MDKNNSVTIELTNTQVERLEEVREDSTEGGELPPVSIQTAISVLLDTYDAVNNGLYTEDYTDNETLNGLVHKWTVEANGWDIEGQTDYGRGKAKGKREAKHELERAIEE